MKKSYRTYLFPRLLRLGQPQISYVVKETFLGDDNYFLAVAYGDTKFTKKRNGNYTAYGNRSYMTISKELYDSYLEEAKRNRKKFRVTRKTRTQSCI